HRASGGPFPFPGIRRKIRSENPHRFQGLCRGCRYYRHSSRCRSILWGNRVGGRSRGGGSPAHGGRMARKLLLGLIAVAGLAANSGCILNQYSSNPNERMQQLLYQSEDLRQINNEWRRFWFNDQPSHLTPERIHGGII